MGILDTSMQLTKKLYVANRKEGFQINLSGFYGPFNSLKEAIDYINEYIQAATGKEDIPTGITIGIKVDNAIVEYWYVGGKWAPKAGYLDLTFSEKIIEESSQTEDGEEIINTYTYSALGQATTIINRIYGDIFPEDLIIKVKITLKDYNNNIPHIIDFRVVNSIENELPIEVLEENQEGNALKYLYKYYPINGINALNVIFEDLSIAKDTVNKIFCIGTNANSEEIDIPNGLIIHKGSNAYMQGITTYIYDKYNNNFFEKTSSNSGGGLVID
jgi:hypothetical protein